MAFRLIFAFLSIVIMNEIGTSVAYQCPPGWALHPNGQRTECFRLYNNSHIEWDNAKSSCLVQNGTLLQILTPEMAMMVRKLFYKMSALAWIGMHATHGNAAGSYQDYKWLNGQKFSLSSPSWTPITAVGKGAEKCVSLFLSHWKLISEACNSKMNYICHKGGADGKWSQWQNSSCSAQCGGGVIVSNRSCTNPAPQGDGIQCEGPSIRRYRCNLHACTTAAKTTTNSPVKTTTVSSTITRVNVSVTVVGALESTEINGAVQPTLSTLFATSVALVTLLITLF